jgi:hypothetical protein
MDKGTLDEQLARAGWDADGSFSEHLAIGNAGDLCIIIPWSMARTDDLLYELYDVERDISYWVREVPTPTEAAQLLREYGKPPEAWD